MRTKLILRVAVLLSSATIPVSGHNVVSSFSSQISGLHRPARSFGTNDLAKAAQPAQASALAVQGAPKAAQGMGPTCIAITKDGQHAFIGFHLSDTVFKVHLADLSVEAVADLSEFFPLQSYRIALDASDKKLFVHTASWNKLLVFDTQTLSLIHTIEQITCRGMIRSWDGRLLLWDGGNTVKYVNTETYAVTEFMDQSIGFLQIRESISDPRKWYVHTQEGPVAPDKIGLYDPATRSWLHAIYIPTTGGIWDFNVLPDESKLYAANFGGFYSDGNGHGSLNAIDLKRWEQTSIPLDGGPNSIEVSPDSRSAYIGVAYDYKGGTNIIVIDAQTDTVRAAIQFGKTKYYAPFGEIRQVQIDPSDPQKLYGVSNDANATFRVDLSTSRIAGSFVFGREDFRPHIMVRHPGQSIGYALIHKSPSAYEFDLERGSVNRLIRLPSIRTDVYSYDAAIDDSGKMLICQGESFLEVDTTTMQLLANHWLPPNTSFWRFVLSNDRKWIYSITSGDSDSATKVFLAISRSDFTVQARMNLEGGNFAERPFELPGGSKLYAVGGWWSGAITIHVIRTDNFTIQKTLIFPPSSNPTDGISAGPYSPYAYDPGSHTLFVGATNVVLAIDTDNDVIKKVINLKDVAYALGLNENSLVYVNAIALVYQPRENYLYMVHLDRAFVSIYDLTNGRFLPKVIPLQGFFPWYAYANDECSRIFVLNSRSDNVSVVDVDAKKVERVIDLHSVISKAFAHAAVGGGYSTFFSLVNTGNDRAEGDLSFTNTEGNPLTATFTDATTLPSVTGAAGQTQAASFHFNVPPGGVQSITAEGLSPSDGVRTGWIRVDGYGGTLGGVATFRFHEQNILKTSAGVLSSDPLEAATLPIDNSTIHNRLTGFAVANSNNENINVTVTVVNQDGSVLSAINPPELNPLGPRKQVARYIHEYLPATSDFAGSIVLTTQDGKPFLAMALIQNQGQYATIPVVPSKAPRFTGAAASATPTAVQPLNMGSGDIGASTTALFPQVAVGGGYTTTFSFMNTGSTPITGRLILTDPQGIPLNVAFSSSTGNSTGSSVPLSLQPGGAQFFTASSRNANDPVATGWARVESSGGTLAGVANFQLANGEGALQTTVGVLSSATLASATIPVDDNVSLHRFTGYAIANPSDKTITIKVLEVGSDGTTVTALSPITLGPFAQIARYFYEDPKAAQTFNGTAVLIGQEGAVFSILALVENQGLFTSIPVISGCSSEIDFQW